MPFSKRTNHCDLPFVLFIYQQRYMFKSVRVDFFEQVIVNGKALSLEQSVQTTICP